jgi:hypothetical protein
VRSAPGETVIVADGFSCKTQIEQAGTGRRALHMAQVMKLARESPPGGYTPGLPEDGLYEVKPPAPPDLRRKRAAAVAGAGLAVAGAVAAGVVAAARH